MAKIRYQLPGILVFILNLWRLNKKMDLNKFIAIVTPMRKFQFRSAHSFQLSRGDAAQWFRSRFVYLYSLNWDASSWLSKYGLRQRGGTHEFDLGIGKCLNWNQKSKRLCILQKDVDSLNTKNMKNYSLKMEQ